MENKVVKKSEDKVQVVANLEVLLKSTREFYNLDRLEYVKTQDEIELVRVFFKDRPYQEPDYVVNVTWGSGISLIRDVLREIA